MKKVPKISFLDIYFKKSAHSFFVAWSLLLVHIRFTPSEGSKGFKSAFKKKLDHESVTMKCDHRIMPFDMM